MQNQKASHKPLVYKGTTLLLSAGFILYSGDTSLKLLDTKKAEASSVTYYETTSNLNLRVSNSTKSTVLLTIPKGEKISYLAKSGSWFKVKFNNRTGWVNNKYVKKAENITSSKAIVSGYQTTANLNLRSKASTNGKILKTIPKGKTLTYISTSGSWIKVKYQTTTGWVSSDYVKKINEKAKVEPAAVVKSAVVTSSSSAYTTKANLNLRSSASTKGAILTTIPKGKSVTYVSKSGSWFKVKYGGKTGWVSSSYLKANSAAAKPTSSTPSAVAKPQQEVTYQATANLNLRSSSSTKGSILTTIPKGKSVTYVSKSGSWFKVKFSGKTGWVSSSYLKANSAAAKPTNGTGTPSTVAKPQQEVKYQATANLNLRSSASTKGSILTTIPKGKSVTYVSKSGSWFKVKFSGKTGWVSSSYLKGVTPVKNESPSPSVEKPKANLTYQTTAKLNLRTEASTQGSVLMLIPKGEKVTYLSKNSFWFKVKYGNKTGWVSSEFLKETTEDKKEEVKNKEIYTTTANLKFRISGSTSATVITTIPKGKQVTYLSKKGSWYKVSFNSLTGWVNSSYLVKGASTSDSSNPISLDSYVTMDLRTNSSVTAAQINTYIAKNATSSNSVLYNRGSIFIDAANKYGVNALYLAAHAIHESNFGKSTISLAKNNLFGYGAYDAAPFVGAVKFNTIKSNIEFIAQMMKATYLNEGYWSYKGAYLGSTVKDSNGNRIDSLSSGMNFYYATDSNWGKAIAKHMSAMLDYSNEGAKNATPNKKVPSRPSYPDAKDVFPTGTLAVAHKTINLTSADNTGSTVYQTTSNLNLRSGASTDGSILLTIPNGKTITYLSASGSWYKVQYNGKTGWVSSEYVTKTNSGSSVSIQAGETFNLLEKHNNESLKVKYKGKMYYTSSFGLSSYYKYMSVKNLARVDATSLNVRSAANTGSSIVGTLSNYQYIELSVDSKNNPVTSNGWYKVKLSNGTQGWVSGMHIIRELNK
ncbi:SH3 domain-containing protein [Bacillus sp. FJAT-27986]|uniref:SH3 domain-containing protein n=1 Tax=Bacillus sp. FJAT-27986 TaxID=1743146 RepID=UPI00080AD50B|nr:SH3 domain-containing protein [Bacillus sp. FJAT-27986]OCA86966.1 hypothetical protein A8L44_06835 [Bacillus sp. FJAT-27986]